MRTHLALVVSLGALAAVAPPARAGFASGKAVAGYISPDDHFSHAVIAKDNGELWEAKWLSQGGAVQMTRLTTVWWDPTITQVAGFYSADPATRHDVVLTSKRDIWDYAYAPGGATSFDHIASLPSGYAARAFDAYYSEWDGYDHYVVVAQGAAVDTRIFEYRVNPRIGGSGYWIDVGPYGQGLAYATDALTVATYLVPNVGEQVCYVTGNRVIGQFYDWCNLWVPGGFGWYVASTQSAIVKDNTQHLLSPLTSDAVMKYGLSGDVMWVESYAWGRTRLATGTGGSIYTFASLNAPTVRSYDTFYEPTFDTIHGVVAMSNGDLWDMRTPYTLGGAVQSTYLGRY